MVHTPAHRSSSTLRPSTRWRAWAALGVGACMVASGLTGAYAAESSDPGTTALRQATLEDAGLSPQDLERERALNRLAQQTGSEFYTAPYNLPERDGDVIRHESTAFYLDPVKLIRPDAQATRIMYRSTTSHGQAVGTTGTVLTSGTPWRKAGPRPLVVLSPGTQGMADHCAPSRQMALGTEYEGVPLTGLLNAGYNVVVPDYIGLGTQGTHTYMNRVDQGHAVLDAARAAQRLGLAGIGEQTPLAMVGYSQGGGATASAVELASDYAPELKLKTGWIGAPPADLPATGRQIDSTLFSGLTFYVMAAAQDSGVELGSLLNDQGQQRFAQAQDSCVVDAVVDHGLVPTSTLTQDGKNFSSHLGDPGLGEYLAEQRIGAQGRRPAVPVRIAHSPADDVVPYRAGRELAQRWCAAGTNVSFQTLATPTHIGGFLEGVPAMLVHLDARFNGLPQVSSCWRLG